MSRSRARLVVLSAIVAVLGVQCTGATTIPERVSDGYVFKTSEKTVARIQDGAHYGVTFVDLSQSPTPPSDADLKKLLAVKSNYTVIEGPVKKLGNDTFKIVTDQKVTIDLARKHGVFWGLDSKKLGDYLNDVRAGNGCESTCYGIRKMEKCADCPATSQVCCCGC